MIGPNKLEYLLLASLSSRVLSDNLVYWAHSKVTKKKNFETQTQRLYSQNFIFFATYEWAQWASVLHYTRLIMLAGDKYSSLLGPIICYEENDLL